jgi:hypothetical protein
MKIVKASPMIHRIHQSYFKREFSDAKQMRATGKLRLGTVVSDVGGLNALFMEIELKLSKQSKGVDGGGSKNSMNLFFA